jgi:hypothetical protein
MVTVPPDVIEVVPRIISVADVPTVRPETIVVPELLRNSALAAVPVADALADKGVPDSVRTPLDTVPGVVLREMVTRTPVAPLRDEVPITRLPAVAVPVEDATVSPAIRSATNCIRSLFSVVE